MDTLYVNFNDVLIAREENGEIFPPKTSDRMDMDISHLDAEIRARALMDLAGMAEKGYPLAPGFLRQLGEEKKALEVEALLLNGQPRVSKAGKRKVIAATKRSRSLFEVDAVLEEKGCKVLVRWCGYHPRTGSGEKR